ncbi:Leucine-rich repeat-containing protein 4B [Argiope bruennichi]|uniref:Leucine-rich repeat-containing protein 4B n=1 Tax=Argiope bruennichi TaxID=94029 RepID=A0A8T0G147_ARGBR|nr:Leucine-rich repeat-containing protein 4B [Argiope bruennichi]
MNKKKLSISLLEALIFGLSITHLAYSQDGSSTTPPPIVTADVCNMSLITSIEGNVETILKKCVCNALDKDVNCNELGITELPNLISFPKGIHTASFEGNKISSLNAQTFYNGRDIFELDLSFNRIDFVSVKAFEAFKSLKRLDLSHNRLWNLPSNAFQGLANLRSLDLSSNDLLTVFPELFAHLTELRELNLKSNPLQELDSKQFAELQKLEDLNLESTLLKFIPDHIFFFMPRLKFLNLANNHLTYVPTDALHVLDHVKSLDLSGNPIEIIPPEAFRGMTGLVNLYMDRMPNLKKIEKYAFGDMIHLQELHCSYNFQLDEISELAFVRKVNNEKVALSQLFLRQNDLKTIPKSLLKWNEDLELHIRENPLYCDCNMEWMVNIKLKNNFQIHARCAGPSDFEGMYLTDLKDNELTCGLHLSDVVLIVCAIATAVLILVLIVAFLLWRRSYAGYRKPYFYAIPKNKHINDIDYTGGDDGI